MHKRLPDQVKIPTNRVYRAAPASSHNVPMVVDVIEIDKSFIDRLAPGDRSAIIVEALISIARKLGVRVVAEGVETEDQVSQLRAPLCAWRVICSRKRSVVSTQRQCSSVWPKSQATF